ALTPYSHHTPLFFLRNRPPPRPTLFPYTTLFRSHARLDRLVEGDPDVLIENGIVQIDRCRAELITLIELEAAAHKQGFSSLSEIDRAVLDPGGSIAFFAKKPTPETARHEEIMKRLEQISAQVAALQA